MAIPKLEGKSKDNKDAKRTRENKFDNEAVVLDEQEQIEVQKASRVVKSIAGKKGNTRTIEINHKDGTKTTRNIKVAEPRKKMPVYIPESLFAQFDEVTTSYGISYNAAICQLIRDYVTEKKSVIS